VNDRTNAISGSARLLTASGVALVAMIGILFLASGPGPSGTGAWWSSGGVQQPTTVPLGPQNGCTKLDDAGSLTCQEVTGWEGPIGVDATGTVWTSPPLVAGERIDQNALIDLQLPGANYAAGNGNVRFAWFAIATPLSDGGVLITSALDGGPGTVDFAYGPSLPGSALAYLTQCIGDSGVWNAVCAEAYCPLGCSTSINTNYDMRTRAPFTAQIASVSPNSGPVAGGTAVAISLTGGATGTTACTLDGVACTGLSVPNDYTIDCASAAGSAGTGNVSCTGGPLAISPLVNGWTYLAITDGGIINSISVTEGPADGGVVRCANATFGVAPGAVTIDNVTATISGVPTTTQVCATLPATANSYVGNTSVSTWRVIAGTRAFYTNGVWPSGMYYVSMCNGTDGGISGASPDYTFENVDAGGGSTATELYDNSGGGYNAFPTATGPALSSTGGSGGNLPQGTFAGTATDNRLENSTYPLITNSLIHWMVGAEINASFASGFPYLVHLGLGGATDHAEIYATSGTPAKLTQLTASAGNVVNVPALGVDFFVSSYFSGTTSSYMSINGGTPVTGTSPGTNTSPLGGLVIGGAQTTGSGWYGNILRAAGCAGQFASDASWNSYATWRGE
jgi:hypothetical protein